MKSMTQLSSCGPLPPTLLCGKFAHFAALLWAKQCHAVPAACFSAFAPHSGHDLRNETQTHGDGFGFAYGLQDHAARVLDGIEAFWFGCFNTCAFWHSSTSVAHFGGSRQAEDISN